MAGLLYIATLVLLVSFQWNYSHAQINNCDRIENCFTVAEFPCSGTMRQVCLIRTDLTGCITTASAEICNAFDFTQALIPAEMVGAAAQACQTVTGGTNAWFGVRDPPPVDSGPNPRNIDLSGRTVTCAGYTNACSASGNVDVLLSVPANACPSTTPSVTTTTPAGMTTTPPAGCTCTPYVTFVPCSVSCGNGVIILRKFCTGSSCTPQGYQTKTAPCFRSTCPTPSPPTPTDGGWSAFGPASQCSVTCGSGGFATRRRTCTNPPPSPGGRFCPGPDTETVSCPIPAVNCPSRTTRRPRRCPPLRRLRKICRKGGRRRRVCRRCFTRG